MNEELENDLVQADEVVEGVGDPGVADQDARFEADMAGSSGAPVVKTHGQYPDAGNHLDYQQLPDGHRSQDSANRVQIQLAQLVE